MTTTKEEPPCSERKLMVSLITTGTQSPSGLLCLSLTHTVKEGRSHRLAFSVPSTCGTFCWAQLTSGAALQTPGWGGEGCEEETWGAVRWVSWRLSACCHTWCWKHGSTSDPEGHRMEISVILHTSVRVCVFMWAAVGSHSLTRVGMISCSHFTTFSSSLR